MKTYNDAIEYLYTSFPVFQKVGAKAYKPGLETILGLLNSLDNPHESYPTIHIAGTNGKGSTSNLIASILKEHRKNVGLFTSPHLIDFRERIRINGEMISKDFVLKYCIKIRDICKQSNLKPSFFELTTAMAFYYFYLEKVDCAVIEVGMGGRLDSTNVLNPIVSVITNVSLDHTAYLGNTLSKIAYEKAGIIKQDTPIVLGNHSNKEVYDTIAEQAKKKNAKLYLASKEQCFRHIEDNGVEGYHIETDRFGMIDLPLMGEYQLENAATALTTIALLNDCFNFDITANQVREGIRNVLSMGLRARFQRILDKPEVYLDTGHNLDAWRYNKEIIRKAFKGKHINFVLGMVSDKDYESIVKLLPHDVFYFFTQPSVERALSAEKLHSLALQEGLEGEVIKNPVEAYKVALEKVEEMNDGVLIVGGSNFVVGDVLAYIEENNDN